MSAQSLRKDLNRLGDVGDPGAGYEVARLKACLAEALGFAGQRRVCIVGLGRLGTAILEHEAFDAGGFKVVAGFEASTNRLETLRTRVPVYPAYEMTEVVRREAVELAVLTVPARAAQGAAEALVAGGVRAILNFAPVPLKVDPGAVALRNVNVINELRMLTSLLTHHVTAAD